MRLHASGQGGLHGREMEEWQRRFGLPVYSLTGSHVTDCDPVTTAKVVLASRGNDGTLSSCATVLRQRELSHVCQHDVCFL